MRKVYKINGKTEVHEVFTSPSGKTKYKVKFSKGNLDPKNRVPARFSTESPIIQAVIEGSPKFNKSIFLEKAYGGAAPAIAAAPAVSAAPAPKKGRAKGVEAKPVEPKAAEVKVMEEVRTIADAVTVLTSEGAPAAEFDGTIEGVIKLAKSLGLSFPNLKGEE